MATNHKYSASHLTATTRLDEARRLDLAAEVAQTMSGNVNAVDRKLQFGWHVEGRGPRTVRIRIGTRFGSAMTFDVDTTDAGLRTEIMSYRTSQEKLLYFIPVGPKTMVGYSGYLKYLTALARALEAADPSSSIRIVERPDREPR